MASDIVQFREDPSNLEFLRSLGVNPNTFGREAFKAALRRLQAQQKVDALRARRIRLPHSIEALVREDRDAR